MITSKQIIKISEEYFKPLKTGKDLLASVFVNPGSSDITKIVMEAKQQKLPVTNARIIADARPPQKVYVWNAYSACHCDVRTLIGISSYSSDKYPYLLCGLCDIVSGNKLKLVHWDDLVMIRDKDFFKKFFRYDWTWLERYMQASQFIKSIETDAKKDGFNL